MVLINLEPFIRAANAENATLRKSGAKVQAEAREALLNDLATYVDEILEETVDVPTAAALRDVHEETVRRFIRKHGDERATKSKGSPMAIRKRDLVLLQPARKRSKQGELDQSGTVRYDMGSHLRKIMRE